MINTIDISYSILSYVLCIWISAPVMINGSDEYCLGETFSASCPNDEVIIMVHAKYGRMNTGKCITFNHLTGCSMDVLKITDKLCSGKQQCSFDFHADEIKNLNPCNTRELASYLETSYICVKVVKDNVCKRVVEYSAVQSLYLPSDSQCGKGNSPWNIKAPAGIRIVINLHDFTHKIDHSISSCTPLAFITQDVVRSNKTICSGADVARPTPIYSSVSSAISVHMVSGSVSGILGTFLIQLDFLGCPDLTISANAWYKRDGEKAEVGCKDDDKVWHLECIENAWIGEYENCTSTGNEFKMAVANIDTNEKNTSLPENTIIFLIIAISVVISAVVLVLGVVYSIKRRNKRPFDTQHATLPLTKDTIYSHNKKYQSPSANMPPGTLHSNTPFYHSNTCKRAEHKQMAPGTLNEIGYMKGEAASWRYQTYDKGHVDNNDTAYEMPYESRAPESHSYFPLANEALPPPPNDI